MHLLFLMQFFFSNVNIIASNKENERNCIHIKLMHIFPYSYSIRKKSSTPFCGRSYRPFCTSKYIRMKCNPRIYRCVLVRTYRVYVYAYDAGFFCYSHLWLNFFCILISCYTLENEYFYGFFFWIFILFYHVCVCMYICRWKQKKTFLYMY